MWVLVVGFWILLMLVELGLGLRFEGRLRKELKFI